MKENNETLKQNSEELNKKIESSNETLLLKSKEIKNTEMRMLLLRSRGSSCHHWNSNN